MTGRHRVFDAKRRPGWMVFWHKDSGSFIKTGNAVAIVGGLTFPALIFGELGVDE